MALVGCGENSQPELMVVVKPSVRDLLKLPPHFIEPYIPDYNPLSAEKIKLGRYLFYDKRLSGNKTQSCASCHIQKLGFADGLSLPTGAAGDVLKRNSQGLANVAYNLTYTWGNNVLLTLEDQILVPLTSDNPIELGILDGNREEILARFDNNPTYAAMFAAAFSESTSGATVSKIAFALASFVRTMISHDSPYDRYYKGDLNALSESAIRGLKLFNGEQFECHHCHKGINFTVSYRDDSTDLSNIALPFFNNGLYNIDGQGSYPLGNQGIFELTANPDQRGFFRPQSLRNIALTAPYMHDGSITTLRGVVEHYVAGGRLLTDGPNAGDGRQSPIKSGLVRPFAATQQEIDDVVAFLDSLTDERFIHNPDYSDPFTLPGAP